MQLVSSTKRDLISRSDEDININVSDIGKIDIIVRPTSLFRLQISIGVLLEALFLEP